MKTAQELYKIAQTKPSEIVAGILDGVREHIIQRCEQEANKGATYYSIYLKEGKSFIKSGVSNSLCENLKHLFSLQFEQLIIIELFNIINPF